MAELNIDIVAVDRKIWSGQGTFLFTRTTSGEIGILPNHIPLVAQLVDDAMVRVEREGEDDLRIAVDGGFLSVTEQGVTVLAESAEFEFGDRRSRRTSATPNPTIQLPPPRVERGCAPWARSTSGPADERVHDVDGRAGRCTAVCCRRTLLSAVEAAPSGRYGGDPAGCPCGRRTWLAPRRDALPGWGSRLLSAVQPALVAGPAG